MRCLSCLFFFLVFSLQHRSGCARQTGDNLSRRSEGGGYSCSCSVFIVVFGALFGVIFSSSFSFCDIEVGNEEWDLSLYERVLYKQFVPSQLTRVHDVFLSPSTSPGRSWLGCSPKLLTAVSFLLVGSTGPNHTYVSQERKSAHTYMPVGNFTQQKCRSTSYSIDPASVGATPYNKSNTTSLVPNRH